MGYGFRQVWPATRPPVRTFRTGFRNVVFWNVNDLLAIGGFPMHAGCIQWEYRYISPPTVVRTICDCNEQVSRRASLAR